MPLQVARAISKRNLAAAREEVHLERLSSRRRSSAVGSMELMPEVLEEVEPDVEEEVGRGTEEGGWRGRGLRGMRCGRGVSPTQSTRLLGSQTSGYEGSAAASFSPLWLATLPALHPECQMAKLPRWQSTVTVRALFIGAVLGACFSIISLKLGLTTGAGRAAAG